VAEYLTRSSSLLLVIIAILFGWDLRSHPTQMRAYKRIFNASLFPQEMIVVPEIPFTLETKPNLSPNPVPSAVSSSPGSCTDWSQVNNNAFGLPAVDGSYDNEEGFEVLVYNDQLYVGQEADNTLGARLWRTRAGITVPVDQSDWEEVAADAGGNPFGDPDKIQNDHIDSLAEFNGYIYVSTANHTSITQKGTPVYRSADGSSGSWIQVNDAGFGSTQNENFKDMIVYQTGGSDYLCGGTWNSTDGAQAWCTTDGTTWYQTNPSGFGDPANYLIASINEYNGALYFGVVNLNGGSLWRTDDLNTWMEVYHSNDRPRIEVMEAFNGYFYIAEGADNGRLSTDPTIRILRSNTGDPGSWAEVGSEIHADTHNTRTIVDGSIVYNGALYVGVMNNTTGIELWRTDGSSWNQVGSNGLGHNTTLAAEMVLFNGYLYAWTSDYTFGQAVLRTRCPLTQTKDITGPGMYAFSDVGASLIFSQEDLNNVTVSVYPDAYPTAQGDSLPIKRFYEIVSDPIDGQFMATLTLSYTDTEFLASDITDENTTYLTRWNGSSWEDCPAADRHRDALENTTSCDNVTALSNWAIAGSNGEPTAIHLATFRKQRARAPYLGIILLILMGTGTWLSSYFYHKIRARNLPTDDSEKSQDVAK
jgi:hypothetical protein